MALAFGADNDGGNNYGFGGRESFVGLVSKFRNETRDKLVDKNIKVIEKELQEIHLSQQELISSNLEAAKKKVDKPDLDLEEIFARSRRASEDLNKDEAKLIEKKMDLERVLDKFESFFDALDIFFKLAPDLDFVDQKREKAMSTVLDGFKSLEDSIFSRFTNNTEGALNEVRDLFHDLHHRLVDFYQAYAHEEYQFGDAKRKTDPIARLIKEPRLYNFEDFSAASEYGPRFRERSKLVTALQSYLNLSENFDINTKELKNISMAFAGYQKSLFSRIKSFASQGGGLFAQKMSDAFDLNINTLQLDKLISSASERAKYIHENLQEYPFLTHDEMTKLTKEILLIDALSTYYRLSEKSFENFTDVLYEKSRGPILKALSRNTEKKLANFIHNIGCASILFGRQDLRDNLAINVFGANSGQDLHGPKYAFSDNLDREASKISYEIDLNKIGADFWYSTEGALYEGEESDLATFHRKSYEQIFNPINSQFKKAHTRSAQVAIRNAFHSGDIDEFKDALFDISKKSLELGLDKKLLLEFMYTSAKLFLDHFYQKKSLVKKTTDKLQGIFLAVLPNI